MSNKNRMAPEGGDEVRRILDKAAISEQFQDKAFTPEGYKELSGIFKKTSTLLDAAGLKVGSGGDGLNNKELTLALATTASSITYIMEILERGGATHAAKHEKS